MSEFKVGDRVEFYFGDDKCEGIIKKIRPNDGICEVSLDGYNTLLVTAIDDISRITKEKTTLENLEQRIEKLEEIVNKQNNCQKNQNNSQNCKISAKNEEIISKSQLLSEDERVILRNLDKKWKWIARDEDRNDLHVYSLEPVKTVYEWNVEGVMNFENFYIFNHLFQFIKWTDKEPYNIEELLKGECGNE